MKIKFYSTLLILLFLQGCTLLYDVSKDVKLKTISVTKASAKTGRAMLWIEDTTRSDRDSLYVNGNDVYTIQQVDKGELFALHGVTKEVEEFDEDADNLIKKYNLKSVSLSQKDSTSSDVLLDEQNIYLTVSEKSDELIYEYTDDMEVEGAKKILLARKKAEDARLLAEQKAEELRLKELERKRLAKQKAEERKILAQQKAKEREILSQQRAEKRKILAQQERAKKLQKVKALKRSIGKRVSWYGSHRVDTDDCVKLFFFKKCAWVTYKYKFKGVLKAVDESSYTIQVTGVKLSTPGMVSMKYMQFKQQGIAWGQGQQGTSKKVSIDTDINIL